MEQQRGEGNIGDHEVAKRRGQQRVEDSRGKGAAEGRKQQRTGDINEKEAVTAERRRQRRGVRLGCDRCATKRGRQQRKEGSRGEWASMSDHAEEGGSSVI